MNRQKLALSLVLVFQAMTPVFGAVWSQGAPAGDNWYHLEPFGYYYWSQEQGGFAYHSWLGWLYTDSESLDSVTLYRPPEGEVDWFGLGEWLWTSADTFPTVYSHGHYSSTSNEVYGAKHWIHLQPETFQKVFYGPESHTEEFEVRVIWAYHYNEAYWHFYQRSAAVDIYERAYRNRDIDALTAYLREVTPISAEDFAKLPADFQETYNVYEAFFDPASIGALLENPQEYDPFSDDALYFIPRQINVTIVGSIKTLEEAYVLPEDIRYTFILPNFKPRLQHLGRKITHQQEETLRNFVAHVDSNEVQKRITFLNEVMTIIPRHWGGLHFSTFPEVDTVYITSDHQTALISFRYSWWEHGQALYEKVDGAWKKVHARITAVE